MQRDHEDFFEGERLGGEFLGLARAELRRLIDTVAVAGGSESDNPGGILAVRVADTLKRGDAEQRIIDVYGKPIPQLYSAGELGSSFGHLYLSGGNIAECIVTGRIAGRNAAAG